VNSIANQKRSGEVVELDLEGRGRSPPGDAPAARLLVDAALREHRVVPERRESRREVPGTDVREIAGDRAVDGRTAIRMSANATSAAVTRPVRSGTAEREVRSSAYCGSSRSSNR
jgi:hypothetical protein